MNKKILKLFMDWIFSEECGFKKWKIKDMKLGENKVWTIRKVWMYPGKEKCVEMTITFEEHKL